MVRSLVQDRTVINMPDIEELPAVSVAPEPVKQAKQIDFIVKLNARNVDFFYGQAQALKNISLQIPEYGVTALIGPSGCGKSTFLRLFNRMNDLIPDTKLDGLVELDNQDIYDSTVDPVLLRTKVGMVFQRPNPFPKSIFENIVFGPRIQGERNKHRLEEIAESSLRQAFLWDEVKDKLHDSAFDLSGGQQQRLCIARAVAVDPEVLLMDEPTAALDPNATFKIEELLFELKNQYTFVIVTHNMQQAARVADRTAFFMNGELIEYDETEKIFTQPENQQTEDYVRGRFG